MDGPKIRKTLKRNDPVLGIVIICIYKIIIYNWHVTLPKHHTTSQVATQRAAIHQNLDFYSV